jgi:hypothetical protein
VADCRLFDSTAMPERPIQSHFFRHSPLRAVEFARDLPPSEKVDANPGTALHGSEEALGSEILPHLEVCGALTRSHGARGRALGSTVGEVGVVPEGDIARILDHHALLDRRIVSSVLPIRFSGGPHL